mmetsp:Transcript_35031/g.90784  ORF Transcript_35031/g.90784 Transcript_35031/m.90784 type:complete len:974 (-) Transcript_35031:100-3021(-)
MTWPAWDGILRSSASSKIDPLEEILDRIDGPADDEGEEGEAGDGRSLRHILMGKQPADSKRKKGGHSLKPKPPGGRGGEEQALEKRVRKLRQRLRHAKELKSVQERMEELFNEAEDDEYEMFDNEGKLIDPAQLEAAHIRHSLSSLIDDKYSLSAQTKKSLLTIFDSIRQATAKGEEIEEIAGSQQAEAEMKEVEKLTRAGDLLAKVGEMEAGIDMKRGAVATLRRIHHTYVEEVEKEMEEMRKKMEAMKSATGADVVNKLKAELVEKEGLITERDKNMDGMVKKMVDAQRKIDKLEKTLTKKEEELREAKLQAERAANSFKSNQAKPARPIPVLSNNDSEMSKKVADAESERDQAKAALSEMEAKLAEAEKRLGSIEKEKAELAKGKASAEARVKAVEEEKKKVEAKAEAAVAAASASASASASAASAGGSGGESKKATGVSKLVQTEGSAVAALLVSALKSSSSLSSLRSAVMEVVRKEDARQKDVIYPPPVSKKVQTEGGWPPARPRKREDSRGGEGEKRGEEREKNRREVGSEEGDNEEGEGKGRARRQTSRGEASVEDGEVGRRDKEREGLSSRGRLLSSRGSQASVGLEDERYDPPPLPLEYGGSRVNVGGRDGKEEREGGEKMEKGGKRMRSFGGGFRSHMLARQNSAITESSEVEDESGSTPTPSILRRSFSSPRSTPRRRERSGGKEVDGDDGGLPPLPSPPSSLLPGSGGGDNGGSDSEEREITLSQMGSSSFHFRFFDKTSMQVRAGLAMSPRSSFSSLSSKRKPGSGGGYAGDFEEKPSRSGSVMGKGTTASEREKEEGKVGEEVGQSLHSWLVNDAQHQQGQEHEHEHEEKARNRNVLSMSTVTPLLESSPLDFSQPSWKKAAKSDARRGRASISPPAAPYRRGTASGSASLIMGGIGGGVKKGRTLSISASPSVASAGGGRGGRKEPPSTASLSLSLSSTQVGGSTPPLVLPAILTARF